MKTFLAVLNAFPAILQTVQVVESAIPMSQSGQHKMDMVLGVAGTAWEVGQVGQQITKANWLSAVQQITNITVTGLNAAGVFSKSTAVAPVSSN
jgi:putative AlgH/UPF0301 family transcriptional regulator